MRQLSNWHVLDSAGSSLATQLHQMRRGYLLDGHRRGLRRQLQCVCGGDVLDGWGGRVPVVQPGDVLDSNRRGKRKHVSGMPGGDVFGAGRGCELQPVPGWVLFSAERDHVRELSRRHLQYRYRERELQHVCGGDVLDRGGRRVPVVQPGDVLDSDRRGKRKHVSGMPGGDVFNAGRGCELQSVPGWVLFSAERDHVRELSCRRLHYRDRERELQPVRCRDILAGRRPGVHALRGRPVQ
jgi:hypothetical protein